MSVEDLDKIQDLDMVKTKECENKEYEKLVNILGSLETIEGSTHNTNIWKQMKKFFPNKSKPITTEVLNIEKKGYTQPKRKKKGNN